ncbi:MAG: SDR family NAD(P)-dependent oxidoreductase [Methylococcaceae bacterium]
MKNTKNIVIVGATSGIAEHCARIWLQNHPANLTLIGRNAARTEKVAADLQVRSPESVIRIVETDFLDPDVIKQIADDIAAAGTIDIVLIAQGSLAEQLDCQTDLSACKESLEVNGISPVLFAEAFAGHLANAGQGTLALIGSVAGDRGRKSNYVYGAAKGMVTRYAQGLQHRFANSDVQIVLIKPGPTDTSMTAHLKAQGAKLAPVEVVAEKIVNAIDRGQPVVYAPGKWQLIMWVIRHMPGFVFNKLNI